MFKEIKNIHTIGYQGISIQEFIKILKQRGIKTVLDIRSNPFSFKHGFTKKWMSTNLPKYKINYLNIPELGIPVIYRKKLSGNNLWRKYYDLMEENSSQINGIAKQVQNQPCVLMCFEANHKDCHRSILADKISKYTGLKIVHYNQKSKEWRPAENKS